WGPVRPALPKLQRLWCHSRSPCSLQAVASRAAPSTYLAEEVRFDAAKPGVAPAAGSRAEPAGSGAPAAGLRAEPVGLRAEPVGSGVPADAERCYCEAAHSLRWCHEEPVRSGWCEPGP